MGWMGLKIILTACALYMGQVIVWASKDLANNSLEKAYVASSLVCCAATLVLAWRVI